MSVRLVLQSDEPPLFEECFEVDDFKSQEMFSCMGDLIDTMRDRKLIGLSAPQIGCHKKVFVTELRATDFREAKDADGIRFYVNPEITWVSKETVEMYESCGSVEEANLYAPVVRPRKVKVKALGADGMPFELEADGVLARVIQHEYDHLEGILFTDKVAPGAKTMTAEEYRSSSE